MILFFSLLPTVFSEDVDVSTSSELINALNNDRYSNIILNDGEYSVSNVNISHSVNISAKSNSTSISSSNGYIFNVLEGNTLGLSTLTVKDTSTVNTGVSSPILVNGNLNVRDCIFSNNTGTNGGVITVSSGNTVITGSSFTGNNAQGNGACINQNGGVLTISDTMFTGNKANRAGGAINSLNIVYIINSYFTDNVAPIGGALSTGSFASIRSSRFEGNNANTSGGAIYSVGDLNILNTIFTDNIASYGGAISISSSGERVTNITSSIFTSNYATLTIIRDNVSFGGTGGAIYNEGILNIMYSSFNSNRALYDGGAISFYDAGSGLLNYNVFKNNIAPYPSIISVDNHMNINLDYNWWGSNDITNKKIIGEYNATKASMGLNDTYDYYSPDNWIILTFNTNPSTVGLNTPVSLTSKFQVKNTNGGVSDFNGALAENTINFQASQGNINPSSTPMINTASSTYNPPASTGLYTVSAILDEERIILPVIVQPANITTLYDTSITPTNFTINSGENITLNILSNVLTVNTGTVRFTRNGEIIATEPVNNGIVTTKLNLEEGVYNIRAEYLSELPFKDSSANIQVSVTGREANTIIHMTDLTKEYLGSENLTGTLLSTDGEAIIGQHLSLTLTRLSSGASKTYDLVTDYTGTFTIPINLAVGNYSAQVVFNGFQNYTSASNFSYVYVVPYIDNRTPTSFDAEDMIKYYNESANFTGILNDDEGGVLIGQHISLTLTRLSSGASKTYDTVTDYTGMFSLTINLAPGLYTVLCSFDGNNEYQSSSKSCTLTVI